MLAPFSVGWRRLMMEAKPYFLISGTAVALMAPEHATVVSRRFKLVMPSTFSGHLLRAGRRNGDAHRHNQRNGYEKP